MLETGTVITNTILQLVTVGDKHIKFWTVAGGGFTSKRGTFGTVAPLDTMLCCAFAKDGSCYSGAANGKVYKFVAPRVVNLS